jgi:glutamine synthetase
VEENVYEMDAAEREARGIGSLPGNLAQAIELAEHSALLKECLGEHVHSKLIENKKIEWDNYRKVVHQYELENYLPKL